MGILSDTHGQLPSKIFEVFAEVDLIIHAGDIGSENIISDLKSLAPVKAVYGNVDQFPLVSKLPRIDFIKVEEITICLTHIVNSFKGFSYELFKLKKKADVVIYGHTHKANVKTYKDILFINPGCVSFPRGTGSSVAVLEVVGKQTDV
jgi:putative phosphoesterase